MADPANDAGEATDGGTQVPPFGVSFDGETVVIALTCVCGRMMVIRAAMPTPARIFLKSYLRNNAPSLENVAIRCGQCDEEIYDAPTH